MASTTDDTDPFQASRPPSYHEDQGEAPSSSSASAAAAAATTPTHHAPLPPPDIDMSTVTIIDAVKTTDHVGASSFIVYVIRCGSSTEARRRYSEFEGLRSALVKLHPTLIIPPIPDKHTLSDYAAKQSKAKEDATIIARRKRMLQSFLRRCAAHPTLQTDAVLRKFLDGRFTWHDISTSPPLSHLPKSNLKAPPSNPADPNANPAYSSLPLPSSSGLQLRHPSQRFLDSEAFTNRFANHMSQSLEKANRRVARRWADSSGDFAELGAVLNGFSLGESGQLAIAIERTGQASDSTFMSIGGLLSDWEQSFTEPLHEYVQFAAVLQKLLKWRHLKHLQFELAQDALEAKRVKLGELERIEGEAQRLERALETGGRSLGLGVGGAAGGRQGKGSIYGSAVEPDDQNEGAGAATVSAPSGSSGHEAGWSDGIGSSDNGDNASAAARAPSPLRHRQSQASHLSATSTSSTSTSGGGGIFSALTSSFSSLLDVDPEQTRRREISRLREEILSLDEALKLTSQDLKWATGAIQADLDRFQRGKVRDLREMMLSVARMHREFCRVNLQNWQEAKASIDAIEERIQHSSPSTADAWPSNKMPESSLSRHEEREQQRGRGGATGGAAGGVGTGGTASKMKRKDSSTAAGGGGEDNVW